MLKISNIPLLYRITSVRVLHYLSFYTFDWKSIPTIDSMSTFYRN